MYGLGLCKYTVKCYYIVYNIYNLYNIMHIFKIYFQK